MISQSKSLNIPNPLGVEFRSHCLRFDISENLSGSINRLNNTVLNMFVACTRAVFVVY